jgi:hypothetical protein
MPYLTGYAVKRGNSLFRYADGHYEHYTPVNSILPGTLQCSASEAIRALNYSNKDYGTGSEIVMVHLEYEPVDMNHIESAFNKERINAIRAKVSADEIDFIKKHM